MKAEKQDRRVRRTKKLIEEALLRVMKRKKIADITVKELAEEADVTRSTFYQYYSDPTQVLESMQQEIAVHIQEIIDRTRGGDAYGFFLALFEYMNQEETRGEIMCIDSGRGSGFEYIGNLIHNNYMLRWDQSADEQRTKQFEYYRYYIVFGCIAVISNWLKNGKQETPQQMAVIAASLLPREKVYLKQEQRYKKG